MALDPLNSSNLEQLMLKELKCKHQANIIKNGQRHYSLHLLRKKKECLFWKT